MPDPTSTTFFSYSRTDAEFVLRLAQDLRAAGAKVWLDQLDIGGGQLWDRAVEEALRTSPRQVAVLSPEAVNSQNVMDEVSYALEERKQVIPVLFRDCQIPFRLRRVQYIDFRTDYDRGLRELLRALGAAEQGAPEVGARKPSEGPLQPDLEKRPMVGTGLGQSAGATELRPETIQKTPQRPPLDSDAHASSKKLWIAAAMVGVLALAAGIWYMATTGRRNLQVEFPAPIIQSTRVYLLAPTEKKATMLLNLRSGLANAGFNVIGQRTIIDPGRPDNPEIRYFNSLDQAQAEAIAEPVRNYFNDKSVAAKRYTDPQARPGYIEIWTGR
jgi:TIR domain-containing protein